MNDIDQAVCRRRGRSRTPLLGQAGIIDVQLSQRLVLAAGFRNVLVHAYADLDLRRVYQAAQTGPRDLREFLASVQDH